MSEVSTYGSVREGEIEWAHHYSDLSESVAGDGGADLLRAGGHEERLLELQASLHTTNTSGTSNNISHTSWRVGNSTR